MLSSELIKKIEKDIMEISGLTKEELDTMDLSDIEYHLGIKAIDPKKHHSLYKIISPEVLEKRRKKMDEISKMEPACLKNL